MGKGDTQSNTQGGGRVVGEWGGGGTGYKHRHTLHWLSHMTYGENKVILTDTVYMYGYYITCTLTDGKKARF